MTKPEKIYRVFLTRNYIAVEWLDIKAASPAKARRKAESVARKLRPDARAEATDNGWIGDDPIEVPKPGHCNSGKHRMTEVQEGIFRCKTP